MRQVRHEEVRGRHPGVVGNVGNGGPVVGVDRRIGEGPPPAVVVVGPRADAALVRRDHADDHHGDQRPGDDHAAPTDDGPHRPHERAQVREQGVVPAEVPGEVRGRRRVHDVLWEPDRQELRVRERQVAVRAHERREPLRRRVRCARVGGDRARVGTPHALDGHRERFESAVEEAVALDGGGEARGVDDRVADEVGGARPERPEQAVEHSARR